MWRYFVLGLLIVAAQGCAGRSRPQPPPQRPPAAATSRTGSDRFIVTAYCSGTRTASGTKVAEGVVAADPRVVPLGSVIQMAGLGDRYGGLYTVMDTGGAIRGNRIDLFVRDCREANRFGRRSARVSVLRRGWNPRDP